MKKYIQLLFAGLLLIGFSVPANAQSEDEIFRAVGSPHNPKVQISFNRYYTAEGHATLTKMIADAYPNLVRRVSIGKSYEGRDMWMLQITNYQKAILIVNLASTLMAISTPMRFRVLRYPSTLLGI